MGEFVKRKHPDIFFSPAIDMELRSDVSLTFLEALIHMIGMFMIHLYGGRLDTYVLETGHPHPLPLCGQGTAGQAAKGKG